jgi:hypothetical protein
MPRTYKDYNLPFWRQPRNVPGDSIALAGEYRGKPNDFKPFAGLIGPEARVCDVSWQREHISSD